MRAEYKLKTCTVCGRRYRDPAHVGSDYCTFAVTYRVLRTSGLAVCHGNWLKLISEAGVPLIKDAVRLEGIRLYEKKCVSGYWIPNWAYAFLHKTSVQSSQKLSRVRRVKYLSVLNDEGIRAEFSAAVRLGNYKGAFMFLDGILKDRKNDNDAIK